jgi:iron complex outermembrane receptor protein
MFGTVAVAALAATSAHAQAADEQNRTAAPGAQSTSNPGPAEPSESDQAGDIIVTANKYEQTLQEVPAAISAFNSKQRDRMGILTNQDLAAFTPSLSISDDPPRVFIRGVGQNSGQRSSDPGVGLYFDGFYANNATAISTPTLITDRIEVLRGPQGTLYGKNTTGGAINIISKRPTDEFTSEFRVNAGNYQRVQTGLTVSGPLASWLRFRATGTYNWQGKGFIQNVAGEDFGVGRKYSLSGQLEADLTSNLQLWVKYDYARTDQTGLIASFALPYNTTSETLDGYLNINPLLGYTGVNPGIANRRQQAADVVNTFDGTNRQLIGHLDWKVGDGFTLRYVGGYSKAHADIVADLDNSARTAPFVYTGALAFTCAAAGYNCMFSPVTRADITGDPKTYSNEINLIVNTQRINAVVGAYQYYEDAPYTSDLRRPLLPALAPSFFVNNPRGTYIDIIGGNKNLTYAGFADLTYKLNDQWSVQGGFRYTYDKKTVYSQILALNFLSPLSSLVCGHLFCGLGVQPASALTRNFTGWSGKIGAQWQPDTETNAYAFVSRGYKAGAITDVTKNIVIPAETLVDYEVGFKRRFSSAFSANLAAYYYNYNNVQIQTNGPDPVTPGNFVTVYVSAPRARSLGFEAEANLRIAKGLDALLVYSYLDAKILELRGITDLANKAAGLQDVSGNRLPQSPRNKVALNLDYGFDALDGKFNLSGNYSYTSAKYFDIFSNNPIYKGKAFSQVDFRLMYTDVRNKFTVIGYVSNLFDVTAANYINLVNGTAQSSYQLNQPRTIGAEFQVRF